MTEEKLDKLIEKRKWGGARPNAGRKSKLKETTKTEQTNQWKNPIQFKTLPKD